MDAQSAEQSVRLALQHQQAGRLADAERIYRDVLINDPKNAQSLYLLGMIHVQTNRLVSGFDLIERAVMTRAFDPIMLNTASRLALQLGNRERALEYAVKAATVKPDSAEAHFNMANALADLSRLDESIAAYQKAF